MPYITCPRNCFDGCMFFYRDGRLIPRSDHPGVDGITCPKAQYIVGVASHKERITVPLLRTRGGWEEISLSRALDIAADYIQKKERTVRIDYSGNMMLLSRRFHHRLFHVLGAPDVRWDICAEAGSEGLKQSWGQDYGMDITAMKGADTVIIWGANVHHTSIHAFTYAMGVQASGGKVFVVDVISSETAKHFQLVKIRPGGDVALALLIMVWLQRHGFHVPLDIDASEEELLDIAGVSKDMVDSVARAIAQSAKPFIFMGYGFQRRKGGGMAVRLISLLPYITHKKPLFYYNRPSYGIDTDYVSGKHLATGEVFSLTQMALYLADVENATIVVMNANPVNTLPRGDKIEEVLRRPTNFTIVHELFMTDTAQSADLIIPAAASVEYEDVMITYGHSYVGWNDAVMVKPPHAITNMDFAREIAGRLSLSESELYEDDMSVIHHVLTKAGIDIDELRRKGYAKLPDIPVREKPIFPQWSDIERFLYPAEKSGFMLLTPSYRYRIHSQYYPFRKEHDVLYISPEDANTLGIDDGDMVEVSSDSGTFRCRVSISSDVVPGILRMFHGVWGSRLSSVINISLSEMGPNSVVSDTFVSIKKVDE